MLVQVYVARGKLADARREIDALIARQPRPVTALTMRGLVAQAQNDAAAAQDSFEKAVDLDPATPIAANNLAWIYAEQGQNLDQALELAKVAQQGLADAAEVHDTLGWVYYKRRTPGPAIAAFTEALKRAPKNPTYSYHLGLAHLQGGDTAQARQALERALASGAPFAGSDEAKRALESLQAQGDRTQDAAAIR
jgi:Tfp pilus assembly protein PilF